MLFAGYRLIQQWKRIRALEPEPAATGTVLNNIFTCIGIMLQTWYISDIIMGQSQADYQMILVLK